jgi:pimeloyl-ACP methyl ester carboxylesterase
VLTSDTPFDFSIGDDAWPAWGQAAAALATSLRATHVTDTSSGHLIPIENPDVIVSAVRAVVDQVR